jgi:RimJ/RimL family protein N-acetyltransferase/ketosteroid isomerase-like protein
MAMHGATDEIARQVKIALEAADLSAFSHLLDPDVRWGVPDDPAPACQSRKQVLAWYQRGRDAGVRAHVSETVVIGDRIVVGLKVRNQTTSPLDDDADRWQVLTVKDGMVTEIAGFETRAKAFDRAHSGSHVGEPTGSERWHEPFHPIADDVIALRLPESLDADALYSYVLEEGGLEGAWVPLSAGASRKGCQALVDDWLSGWQNRRSFHAPALVIVDAEHSQLVGCVGLGSRDDRIVELTYGIAPWHRNRGYATRAARLAALWLLDEDLARTVELIIGKDHKESQRVATAAGFVQTGSVRSHVAATGETFQDVRYVFHGLPEPGFSL